MVRYVEAQTSPAAWLRIGVGDAREHALGDRLAKRLGQLARVREVVRYRVGPSVSAHTGLGTVGVVFYDATTTAG
jgi:fatty acid-binding protein DegV